jgi:hypothetical protein
MHKWIRLLPIISLNAWLLSAYFHSKKTEFSSLIDYIGALILISYSTWIVVRRVWGNNANETKVNFIFITSVVLILYRIYYMYIGKISFDSHMTLCISLSVCHVSLWLIWIFILGKENKQQSNNNNANTSRNSSKYCRIICFFCQILFIIASMLEIFDFPPYFEIFDAHSLWHALTVPLGMKYDCLYLSICVYYIYTKLLNNLIFTYLIYYYCFNNI